MWWHVWTVPDYQRAATLRSAFQARCCPVSWPHPLQPGDQEFTLEDQLLGQLAREFQKEFLVREDFALDRLDVDGLDHRELFRAMARFFLSSSHHEPKTSVQATMVKA